MKTNINLSEIFDQQIELDKHIHSNHHLSYDDIFEELKLALAVELGELANEVRCFKFWSFKQPSEKEVILEEYVDGIHFITSLAIAKNIKNYNQWSINVGSEQYTKKEITILFNELFVHVNKLNNKHNIVKWYKDYIELGYALGFSFDEIKSAYTKKNEINHQRQNNNY